MSSILVVCLESSSQLKASCSFLKDHGLILHLFLSLSCCDSWHSSQTESIRKQQKVSKAASMIALYCINNKMLLGLVFTKTDFHKLFVLDSRQMNSEISLKVAVPFDEIQQDKIQEDESKVDENKENIVDEDKFILPVLAVPGAKHYSRCSGLFQCSVLVKKNGYIMYYQHSKRPVLWADKQLTLNFLPKYYIFDISQMKRGCFVPLDKDYSQYIGKIRRDKTSTSMPFHCTQDATAFVLVSRCLFESTASSLAMLALAKLGSRFTTMKATFEITSRHLSRKFRRARRRPNY